MASVAVIGAGFSGISAAAYLAKQGNQVHVFEKNEEAGGRARQLRTAEGFVFDMGPSWYWMPDIIERFFRDFEYKVQDWFDLKLLDPSFEIVFGKNDAIPVPADFDELCRLFDSMEPDGALHLREFMNEAAMKYRLSMDQLIYRPSLSFTEFISPAIIRNTVRSDIFMSFRRHVKKYFSDARLIALMEFPVLFLGAKPTRIPALYSLMNYAGLKLGTWYPEGGFGKVIDAMKKVAEEQGVVFHFNSPVEKIDTAGSLVSGIEVHGKKIAFDGIIASADYHHAEELLPAHDRNYNHRYWEKKTWAPSSLIFYLGIGKKISRLQHHTLFFDKNLDQHCDDIYTDPKWPLDPLFYACCPSRSDDSVAPGGCENLFVLMPVAAGIDDDESVREKYYAIMMERLEEFTGETIRPDVIFKKSYCVKDFIRDYNAFKGNAYGLANTLSQTAILKPKIKNYKLKNLFYAGQLTVPGPGVPPSIISGKIAAGLLGKYLSAGKNEVAV